MLRAHFGLPSVTAGKQETYVVLVTSLSKFVHIHNTHTEDSEGRPPITVKFEIPYFTTSGIQVLSLHSRNLSVTIATISWFVHTKRGHSFQTFCTSFLVGLKILFPAICFAAWH